MGLPCIRGSSYVSSKNTRRRRSVALGVPARHKKARTSIVRACVPVFKSKGHSSDRCTASKLPKIIAAWQYCLAEKSPIRLRIGPHINTSVHYINRLFLATPRMKVGGCGGGTLGRTGRFECDPSDSALFTTLPWPYWGLCGFTGLLTGEGDSASVARRFACVPQYQTRCVAAV